MSQELPGLIAEQENICDLIVKAQVNFKKTPKARLTRGYIKTRKESIENYFSQFVANNRALIKISTPSDKAKYEYFKDDVYSACEEMFIDLKAEMTDMLEGSTPCTSSTNPTPSTSSDDVKLPKIDIAKFTGNYQDWTSFYDMFTSLIHNKQNLSSVQKMHYLKSYLSGEPAQLLDHLAVTETNYELAWLTLQNRYNNKRVIVNSILSKLMNQKKIHAGTAKAIREILDTTMECLNKLQVQNINTSSWDTLIIHIIVEKLDNETHKEWEEEASNLNLTELPTMVMFKKFLEKRFRVLEMMQPSQTTNMNMKSTYRNIQREPNFTVESKSFHVSPAIKCGFCKQNHYLNQCKEFQELTLEKKTEFIQNHQVCFNCLIHGHAVRFCKSKYSCQKCGRRHHTMLHNNTYQPKEKEHREEETNQERENKEFKRERDSKQEPKQDMKNKREIVAHLTTGSMTGLLSTAQINVTNHQGREFVLRALLDPCSQESFLNESAAQTMGLKRKRANGNVSGLDQMSTPIRFAADIEISSRLNPEKKMSITTYIVKRVTNIMPSEKLTIDNWVHLRDLQLADPTYHQPSSIDILLGVEVYNEMIQPGLIKGIPGSPIALQTHLGWIISGKVTVGTEREREEKPFISMHLNVELNHMLKRFWELETIEEEKHKLTAEESKVEEIYEKTTTRDEDGRYIVDLPMRHEPPVLPSNSREIALKRWKSTEHRLKSNPHLLEEYNKVLEEYMTLNHMKKIENKDEENGVWLPQLAVIKMERETSKLRIVYDASCKGSNGVSLNDELLIGPPLLEDLRAILIRWRTYKIAFVADVEKMYRQIRVKDEHTNYQRIVWRPDPKGPIEDFKLLTVTFGTSCAPYLAIKTLRQTAKDEGSDYPKAQKMILRDFYMDDLLSGTDEEKEAIEIQKQVTKILSSGGFPLKKWCSNSEEFMTALDKQEKREETQTVEIKRKESVKTLGITWEVKKDKLLIPNHIKNIDDTLMTKRSVLSEIASIFDPMGWIAPSVILAKIFMQVLWKKGISWDEELPAELKKEWLQYKRELPALKDVSLDRWMHTTSKSTLELHGYADASVLAYAAVIYSRVIDEEGEIRVSLVTAKTKVSPIRKVSLPRLELLAATLLSKLLKQVADTLDVHLDNVYAYSDSQVTLA
ncbi:uncharacterized protein LOC134656613 [Cydia amplana]|uniref:uncharacterized protein LOC134656613 n=1 Tax=Cydia amplana TaxID=1869771 RepID=UPI002FE69950